MSPSNNNPGVELPPPIAEAPQTTGASNEVQNAAHEKTNSAPEAVNTGSKAAASVPLTIPLPYDPTMTPQQSAPTTSQSSSAQVSDDKDLIDKEWVDKAKAIVERTRNDPYKQSEDLTLLKADYMKKQYSKTIRISK
jgi:hypothetical protein